MYMNVYEYGRWSDIQKPPTPDVRMSEYAVIYHADNFYYFGGSTGVKLWASSILCLHAASWTWSNVGQLNSACKGHGVIRVKNTFVVIGGLYTQPTEVCVLEKDQFTCEEKISNLDSYAYSPLLFLVIDEYRNC